jgi:hypothetical protein
MKDGMGMSGGLALVGDQHNRAALVCKFTQPFQNDCRIVLVQVPRWFIGEKDLGMVEERSCERGSLSLASAEHGGHVIGTTG